MRRESARRARARAARARARGRATAPRTTSFGTDGWRRSTSSATACAYFIAPARSNASASSGRARASAYSARTRACASGLFASSYSVHESAHAVVSRPAIMKLSTMSRSSRSVPPVRASAPARRQPASTSSARLRRVVEEARAQVRPAARRRRAAAARAAPRAVVGRDRAALARDDRVRELVDHLQRARARARGKGAAQLHPRPARKHSSSHLGAARDLALGA